MRCFGLLQGLNLGLEPNLALGAFKNHFFGVDSELFKEGQTGFGFIHPINLMGCRLAESLDLSIESLSFRCSLFRFGFGGDMGGV